VPDNKKTMGASYATQPLMVALDNVQALSAKMTTETRLHWTRLDETDEMPMQQQGQRKTATVLHHLEIYVGLMIYHCLR
jgi:hypothetical protein